MKGILGRKIGMTQVFAKDGKLVPVTVVEIEPNVVTQIKTKEKDGYDAVQLGAFTMKEKNSNKAAIGHKISISASCSMSPAVTGPSFLAFKRSVLFSFV